MIKQLFLNGRYICFKFLLTNQNLVALSKSLELLRALDFYHYFSQIFSFLFLSPQLQQSFHYYDNYRILPSMVKVKDISSTYDKQKKKTEPTEEQSEEVSPTVEKTEANKPFQLRRTRKRKNSAINFLQIEDTFKVVELLNSELTKEEAVEMYQNDGSIAFVTQLIADEQRYFNIMQNAGTYRLSLLLEKLRRVMMDHKHLFQLVLRLKSVVNASIQLIQSHNLDEALQKIVFATSDCLECDRATCFMVDEAKQELWSKVAQGVGKKLQFPMSQGIAGYAAKNQSVVNIQDAYQDDRFNKHFDQLSNYRTKTILAMPILEKGSCLGVLQCINKIEGLFTKEDELMLKMLGELANTVLKNVVKHKEQMLAQNKFRTALKASQLMVENCNDLAKLMSISELWIRKLMNVDTVKVSLLKDKLTLVQIDEHGSFIDLPINIGMVGVTMQTGQVYLSSNSYQDIHYHPQVDINSNLPVLSYPIQKKNGNEQETIGTVQFIHLKGIGKKFLSEFGLKLPPIDHEIAKKIIKLLAFTYSVWNQMHSKLN